MKIITIAYVGCLLSLASFSYSISPGQAQGSGICPGLSGQNRTRCLQAESRRASVRAAEANRKAREWDAIRSGACAGNIVGQGAISVSGGAGAGMAAAATWAGAQSLTYKVMGKGDPCK